MTFCEAMAMCELKGKERMRGVGASSSAVVTIDKQLRSPNGAVPLPTVN